MSGQVLQTPVTKFIVPYEGEKVDYVIGLSYWLAPVTGLYDNAIVNIIPPVGDYEMGL